MPRFTGASGRDGRSARACADGDHQAADGYRFGDADGRVDRDPTARSPSTRRQDDLQQVQSWGRRRAERMDGQSGPRAATVGRVVPAAAAGCFGDGPPAFLGRLFPDLVDIADDRDRALHGPGRRPSFQATDGAIRSDRTWTRYSQFSASLSYEAFRRTDVYRDVRTDLRGAEVTFYQIQRRTRRPIPSADLIGSGSTGPRTMADA